MRQNPAGRIKSLPDRRARRSGRGFLNPGIFQRCTSWILGLLAVYFFDVFQSGGHVSQKEIRQCEGGH